MVHQKTKIGSLVHPTGLFVIIMYFTIYMGVFKYYFQEDRAVDKALDYESRGQGFKSQAGQVTVVLFAFMCH